ncbi:MAG: hypothetical protein EXR62_11295 [Chloroflexi bacterium]|nr:hypothetical protein [Chloroflexota bacterium]
MRGRCANPNSGLAPGSYFVWLDKNGDGVRQAADEPGLAVAVTVNHQTEIAFDACVTPGS